MSFIDFQRTQRKMSMFYQKLVETTTNFEGSLQNFVDKPGELKYQNSIRAQLDPKEKLENE